MARTVWPTGIRPDGAGLRIKLWEHGKEIYSETLPGDSTSKSLLTAAKNRRKWLKNRLELGLPLYEGEENSSMFEDVAQDYMDTLDAKHSTHMSYENILNHYWMPRFTGWPVDEISTRIIKEALASFKVTNKTKKNTLIPLRGVLGHAEVNPNPCTAISFKRQQKQAVDRYTFQEREKLLNALSGQAQVYFAVLFGCGLRAGGEPLALNWTDYDGEQLNISKQITKRRLEPSTKTSVRRKVYVPTWLRPYLDNHPTRFEGGYIFQNTRGGPYLDTDIFNAAWKKAHKKTRIPYRIPYTCRHTRASELLSTGVEPADAAKQMGHSVEMFFRIYAEWIEEYSRNSDLSRFEGTKPASSPARSDLKGRSNLESL